MSLKTHDDWSAATNARLEQLESLLNAVSANALAMKQQFADMLTAIQAHSQQSPLRFFDFEDFLNARFFLRFFLFALCPFVDIYLSVFVISMQFVA
jgi:hypothetical protein